MGADLIEKNIPLSLSLAPVGKLKLMSIQILPEGQEKELLSLC